MTIFEFKQALEEELRRRGVPFHPADVTAFVPLSWTLIREDFDVPKWADVFVRDEAAPPCQCCRKPARDVPG